MWLGSLSENVTVQYFTLAPLERNMHICFGTKAMEMYLKKQVTVQKSLGQLQLVRFSAATRPFPVFATAD